MGCRDRFLPGGLPIASTADFIHFEFGPSRVYRNPQRAFRSVQGAKKSRSFPDGDSNLLARNSAGGYESPVVDWSRGMNYFSMGT